MWNSLDFMIFNIDNFIYRKEIEDNCNNIIRLYEYKYCYDECIRFVVEMYFV